MADLPQSMLLRMFRAMQLTRTLEETIATLVASQDPHHPLIVGKGYLSTGQEAISVGAACALEEKDWYVPSHRDAGGYLIRGLTARDILMSYSCRKASPSQGRDGNVHIGCPERRILGFVAHMGSTLPVANGLAAAMVYQSEPQVVMAIFGDGASSQGVVHEAMNYAGVFKLPVVYVINNNHWAISTPVSRQMPIADLAERAAGYAMPAVIVDGNHVTEVYAAVRQAVDRARKGEGPSIVECKTMRMTGHGTHDSAPYIPRELLEEWKKKDPLLWFQQVLLQSGIQETELKMIRQSVEAEVHDAVEAVRAAPVPRAEDLPKDAFS